jgi:hypothetical protein
MVEASAIRKKVVDNRNTIQRAFSDIHLKSNTELLSDLRLFMRKPIEYAAITSASSSIAYSHLVINVSPTLHSLLILVPFDIHLSQLEDIVSFFLKFNSLGEAPRVHKFQIWGQAPVRPECRLWESNSGGSAHSRAVCFI